MPSSARPTISQVATAVEAFGERLDDIQESLATHEAAREAEGERIWTTLGSLGERHDDIRDSLATQEAAREAEGERIWTTLGSLGERLDDIQDALGTQEAAREADDERIWTTLGSLAGLDGIARGLADIRELLGPLRLLAPPATALPLERGVPGALTTIRSALGVHRDTNFPDVVTDWDDPVGVIGQADPGLDPEYPYAEDPEHTYAEEDA